MTDQYQEHLDFEMGAASEAQNCFAEARMALAQAQAKANHEIDEASRRGSWIVTEISAWHCRATDAVAGCYTALRAECDSQAEAEEKAAALMAGADEYDFMVLGPEAR